MGIFDKLLGKSKPVSQATAADLAYVDLLSAYIGQARLHQLAFGEIVKGKDWDVDFTRGLITFGEDSYPVQFLGSESESSHTWLWGVENINGFPEAVLTDVTRFHQNTVEKLRPAQLLLDEVVTGHNLASLISASHPDNACYYRCPYEGGAAYVLVKELDDSVFAPAPAMAVAEVIRHLIGQMPMNHRILVESLLQANCQQTEAVSTGIKGAFKAGDVLTATFDTRGRLAAINIV